MAKDPVLVTDSDALEQDGLAENYISADGVEYTGEQVAAALELGVDDLAQLPSDEELAQMRENAQSSPNEGTSIGGLVDKMGSAMLERKIIGKLVGSKGSLIKGGLTWVAVAAMRSVNILPSSMQPLLSAASNLIGSVAGPTVQGVLDKIVGVLPESEDTSLFSLLAGTGVDAGSYVLGGLRESVPELAAVIGLDIESDNSGSMTHGDDFLERDEGDVTIASPEARVRAIYANIFNEDAPDFRASDKKTVCEYMFANGKLMAEDGVFASCANKDSTDREFAGMRAVTSASCDLIEDGLLNPIKRGKCAEAYLVLAEGLAAYESGAREGFEEKYKDDPEGMAKAEAGLNKIMAASRGPVLQSILDAQEKYDLFSEEEMDQIRELFPDMDVNSDQSLESAIAASYTDDSEAYSDGFFDDLKNKASAALGGFMDGLGLPVDQEDKGVVQAEPAPVREIPAVAGIEHVTVDTEPEY